mmetsp:Transcript_32735/g.76110  ORF Transcript_32735/g.76110 Transcript_32735/m.76110 type:complete len:88 (-) Transcript_32735:170-433(-)|eukprot:CAMPEP_0171093046 /NCGR_PEP_ID=MMETSP0766_2-20121228/38778_1 /TAXON_ID=439317 /ORGANISM="Gambierdiscus australes, Strain CAWD 149" /LENGTH=87 /DNA_ID=CAMNT_0011551425 /DNA_START=96 /DNA_END=359 /DNA_ORIENTATION=-
MASLSPFEGLSREELMQKVVELQQGLADLSVKVDAVKGENTKLRDENVVLKDYLNNLMAKVGKMSNVGSTVQVGTPAGESTVPAMDS